MKPELFEQLVGLALATTIGWRRRSPELALGLTVGFCHAVATEPLRRLASQR